MSKLNSQNRLYIQAAETLQQNAEVTELANSLCRMFISYLHQQDEEPEPNKGLTGHHFNLLLSYLFTIREDFHENHLDYSEVFTDVLLTYSAGEEIMKETKQD